MSKWIKCSERLPEQGQRVLCVSYGTDVLTGEDQKRIDVPPRHADETKREYSLRCIKAYAPLFEMLKYKIKHIEIGFIDDNGFWCDDMGFPLTNKPLVWKSLPVAPSYEAVKRGDIECG